MTTKLSDLMAELSASDRRDVEKRKSAHLRAMADARRLPELRQAAEVKQVDVARAMRVGQNAISQLENRTDWQLSTLSRYMKSVGYRLEIALVDPSGDRVLLTNFRPWEESPSKAAVRRRPTEPRAKSPARAPVKTRTENAAAAKGSTARAAKK